LPSKCALTPPGFPFREESPGTTVQDQYLIMLMLSLLSSGNLSLRQFNFSYQILCLVSNRMSLQPNIRKMPALL
jgi:hypothetical protein